MTEDFVAKARAAGLADRLAPSPDLVAMIGAMSPRGALILMVPAGAPVDKTLAEVAPHLDPGDIVIDAGNTDFHDTQRRDAALSKQGLHFVGMGLAGGEDGARIGPSIMVGGSE